MKITIILLLILYFFNQNVFCQDRTIQGCVISEDLKVLSGVYIFNIDTVLIGRTDIDGRFKIDISNKTNKLLLRKLGLEWTTIELQNNCDTVNIIMMYFIRYDLAYDFSLRKANRLRLKRFKKIPKLHSQAFYKGLFNKKTICYSREFEPIKPELSKFYKKRKRRRLGFRTNK